MIPRSLEMVVAARLSEEPVILIEGPRSVGKSALLRTLADRFHAQVIDLDDLATRDAVDADPGTFVGGQGPVFVDEYQKVLKVLDAIKSELNRDGSPGRFILTGSARHDSLPAAAQALTGRLHTLPLYPLSQGEINGTSKNLIAELFSGAAPTSTNALSSTTRADYIEKMVVGGFPLALTRPSEVSRNRWFDNYINLTLARDARELSQVRQATILKEVLEKLAGQTAQVLSMSGIATSMGVNKDLVVNYTKLLEAVFLVYRLPAWGNNLTTRSNSHPKIHVMDSGVAARLLRLTPAKLATLNATAMSELGHLLETFVVGELVRQACLLDGIAGVGHWRTYDGEEVDFVVERDDGAIIAFEVKAGSQIPSKDFAPMRKLRDKVGSSFLAGLALYPGQRSYTLEDRIHVMPVDRIWLP
jgi:predicted AAA+ superfamily ATPase